MMKTPVVLFNGFLEAGKTLLLNEALLDDQWCDCQKLVVLCEEGLEELSYGRKCSVEIIEDPEQLNGGILEILEQKYVPEVVFIEYNGMWLTHYLTSHLPENWEIIHSYLAIDAETFSSYNRNMRSLMVDKIAVSQYILFNRCSTTFDQQGFHDVVRKINLKTQIAFEFPDGQVLFDELPIKLPYDLDSTVIEVADTQYALFYRDLTTAPERYLGKTISFKGNVKEHLSDGFIIGRMVMVCCEQDMSFCSFSCKSQKRPEIGMWVQITGVLCKEYLEKFQHENFYIQIEFIEKTEALEVATYE